MTAAVQLNPSDMGAILRAFASGLRVANVEGINAEAEHTSADRLVWIPGAMKATAKEVPWQPIDGEAIEFHHTIFDVSIYASSYSALWARWADFRQWANVILGPMIGDPDGGPGYEIGDSEPKPRGDPVSGQGWGVVVPITIKGPIYRRRWPTAATTVATYGVETTGAPPEPPADPEHVAP